MNIVVLFFALKSAVLRLPMAVRLCITWVVVVNVVGAIYFMPRTLAWLVFISFMLNLLVMGSVLIETKGWIRILGRSHLPLLSGMASVVSRLDRIDFDSTFGWWIVALMVTNCMTLIFATYNVWRYWQGNRALAIHADVARSQKQVMMPNIRSLLRSGKQKLDMSKEVTS